jgi:hypothetical protein
MINDIDIIPIGGMILSIGLTIGETSLLNKIAYLMHEGIQLSTAEITNRIKNKLKIPSSKNMIFSRNTKIIEFKSSNKPFKGTFKPIVIKIEPNISAKISIIINAEMLMF